MPTHSASTTAARYSPVAQALHWVLGAALVGVFALGLYMADLPFSPQRLKLYSWHKWAGMSILALSVLRLLWRLTHRPPALPLPLLQTMPVWQQAIHTATQHLFYVFFLLVPLLGWAYSSAAGFPVVLFGVLPLPDFVPVSPALAEGLKPLHKLSAFVMAALVLLHVAAVFKHQWLDRDGLLTRMLPGRS